MDENNNSNHPQNYSDTDISSDHPYSAPSWSDEAKVDLEKYSEKTENNPYSYENQTDKSSVPNSFGTQPSNGDYVTPGYSNNQTYYENTSYISQDSTDTSIQNQRAKNLAIASLVCGIVSLVSVCSCCLMFLGIPASIAALVTGLLSKYENGQRDSMAIAGIICGIVSIVLFFGIMFFSAVSGMISSSEV